MFPSLAMRGSLRLALVFLFVSFSTNKEKEAPTPTQTKGKSLVGIMHGRDRWGHKNTTSETVGGGIPPVPLRFFPIGIVLDGETATMTSDRHQGQEAAKPTHSTNERERVREETVVYSTVHLWALERRRILAGKNHDPFVFPYGTFASFSDPSSYGMAIPKAKGYVQQCDD